VTEFRDRKGVTEKREGETDGAEGGHASRLGGLAGEHKVGLRHVFLDEGAASRGTVRSCVANAARSGISTSNIAEGAASGAKREFRQFLMIARGSLAELETQVLVA
jgi:hypothetical protein